MQSCIMKVIDAIKYTLKNQKAQLVIAFTLLTIIASGLVYYLYPATQIFVVLIAKATLAYVLSYFASLIAFGEVDWSEPSITAAKIGHLVLLLATAIIFGGFVI